MKKAPSKNKTNQPARGKSGTAQGRSAAAGKDGAATGEVGAATREDGAAAGRHGSSAKGGQPIRKDHEVRESNDEHIDQDFPGFPDHPSHRRTIHNGSAGAFDATEHSHDEDDEDQDSDDFAMDD